MTGTSTADPKHSTTDDRHLSQEAVLEVVSNQRRRFALHCLKRLDGDHVTVADLADRVAALEYEKCVDQLTYRERKRVQNALRQYHLPKMEDTGFVEVDSSRGTVSLTDQARAANVYTGLLTGGDVPWGICNALLSAVFAVGVLGIWAGLYPFSQVSPLAWGGAFSAAFLAWSLAYCYDTYYRLRLGAGTVPADDVE